MINLSQGNSFFRIIKNYRVDGNFYAIGAYDNLNLAKLDLEHFLSEDSEANSYKIQHCKVETIFSINCKEEESDEA